MLTQSIPYSPLEYIPKYLDMLNSPYGKSILKMLEHYKGIEKILGVVIPRYSGAIKVDHENVAMWFMWASEAWGERETRQKLDEFIEAKDIEINVSLWVLGIELDSSIHLGNGFGLVPPKDMPESFYKYYFQQRFMTLNESHESPKCAITKTMRLRKTKENYAGPENEPEYPLRSSS